MASVSTPFPISLHPKIVRSKPLKFRVLTRPIKASGSETPPDLAVATRTGSKDLPIRNIPGNYGLPIVGPIKDRWDYFYDQGAEEFFKSRIRKYNSTVYRVNMPPGGFIAENPQVVALLDGKSFPVLFDVDKVEKKDLFTGTYMPSTDLTGGYRILSYLDPSDGTACNFLARAFYGTNPVDTKLKADAPGLITKWVLFNLHPLLSLGLPRIVEDPLLHTFSLPPALVKSDYQRLYEFFYESAGEILVEADKLGISREEATHNLLFATCFNTWGGMKILFPNMVKRIGRAGHKVHNQLAEEIRSVIKSNGGELTMGGIEKMELTKSVVYECLRFEPPVPAQYGRAKKDLVIESHDAAFKVKAGEMLYGYQPLATRDPKIFDRADEFVPERFVGEEGEKLLRHVLWSNGPETETPTVGNKQCAGKDFVVLVARLFVIEIFRRYDSFDIEVAKSPLGSSVNFTSLRKASF
ncbi:allene oxide synthase, chloroplastic [Arabidopsis lyrata subsp. lyrata]|uniref:allene oxide synthase, chloroplastic n=1 Tax=Arabidopsis lyrata subsp. lyrata TaxID=81972 RepID=UPI000A29DF96|nr:allene oxide synthase, chloroplastic [Arabidopsis lyrata subsp. lyrata]|eukprot:XP_020888476.1 allene oxide synthase, chloroplastic [Arabidopsis lyrata subsp. lyrata]